MKKLKLIMDNNKIVFDIWEVTAYIGIDSSSEDDKESIRLSPDFRSAEEVHRWADAVIQELETIKQNASEIQWNNQL